MIWAFQKGSQQTRCEVRRQADGDAYEFVVTRADGKVDVEQYENPTRLIERSVAYLDGLRQEGWQAVPLDAGIV
jgi:hypothetical protein